MKFGSGLLETFRQQFNDWAHAVLWPCESLDEDALEERREGTEWHFASPGISEEEDREAEEILQPPGFQMLCEHFAGGAFGLRRVCVGALFDAFQQCLEARLVGGKLLGDSLLERRNIIVQPEFRGPAADGGVALGTEPKLFASDAELPEDSVERSRAVLRRREVGEGVQPRVEDAATALIPRIQSSCLRVALEDAYALPEVRQTDAGRQPRQPRANYNDIEWGVDSQMVRG